MAMSRPGHYCGGEGGRCWRRKTVERERQKPSWKKTSLNAEPSLRWPAPVGQRDKDSLLFVQVGLGGGVKNEKNLTCGALAFIAVRVIDALGPVQTRSAGTVININLANRPGEA